MDTYKARTYCGLLALTLAGLGLVSCRSTQGNRGNPYDGIVETSPTPVVKVDDAITAAGQALAGSLGNGWDSELHRKFAPCLDTADYSYRGAHASDLTVMRDFTYDQLMDATEAGLYGKASLFGLVSAKIQGSMATTLASTDDSTSYISNFNVVGKSVVLGERRLNENGSSAYNASLVKFREQCGDQFVQQVRLGGQLYIGVKYTFASKEVKDEIKLKISLSLFWGLIKVSKTWSKEFKDLMKNVRVSLEAFQIGGDPRKLQALKDEIYTGSCAGDEPDVCAVAIDRLLSYGAKEFPAQLGDLTLSQDPYQGPAIIDLSLENYRALKIIDPKQNKAVMVDVTAGATPQNALSLALEKLEKTKITLKITANRIKTLKEFKLDEGDRKQVDEASAKLDEALNAIEVLTATTCARAGGDSSFIDSCLARANEIDKLAKAATVPVSLKTSAP